MSIPITVTLALPGTENAHDDAACRIWLDAVLAAPPYKRNDGTVGRGTPPLWAELLDLALRRGWPRDGLTETRPRFEEALRLADQLAGAAGAPSSPTFDEHEPKRAFEHRTACETSVRLEFPRDDDGLFLPATITVSGQPASVYRRAAAAAAALETFEREWKRDQVQPVEEVEVVKRYTGDPLDLENW